ncbi:MAG: sigma-70 family RNA polymerase sigma factor [Acidimicrobiia bacterium]
MTSSEWFESLWVENADLVYLYAARRVGPDFAPDIVGETFTVAWSRGSHVPSPALPWLYGVARNVIGRHRRTETRYFRLIERAAHNPAPDAIPMEMKVIERDIWERALRALDETDREALLLVAWEGLSPAEAAVVMGYSAGAFRVRLSRARRRLRRQLEQTQTDSGVSR